MKEVDFSSWQKVNALKAAQAILKLEERGFLEPFVGQEKSVGEAAAELGVAVDSMAYRVRRLKGLGLLTHTRSVARKGRAIKYYRAAPGFVVALEVLPFADLAELFTELDAPMRTLALKSMAALAEAAGLVRWSVSCYRDEAGRLRLELAPPDGVWPLQNFLHPGVPPLLFSWLPLHVTHEQAKGLQAELVALLEKYVVEAGTPTHLLGLFLPPLEPERL